MFSLFGPNEAPRMIAPISFNTDTIFDLMSGGFERGYDGKWYLNGGLGPAVAGIQGRQQTFKSTFAGSLLMRMSAIYNTQALVFDSELAFVNDLDRVVRLAGDHASKITTDYVIPLDAKTKYDLESIRKMIYELGEKKKAAGKDALITTPFIDLGTGKRIQILQPSSIFIDSYTECFSTAENELVTGKGLDDSRANTLAMLDANKKTSTLRNLSRYAADYGMQIVASAHYGKKMNMDAYAPQPKYLPWANQDDAPKQVGSKWGFLTSPLALINGCSKLLDDAKQAKYQLNKDTHSTDLFELAVLVQRCKKNASGSCHPFVVSQDDGLLNETSDYNYLRGMKAFGFLGNNITHQNVFLPDVSMTRNSFRGICQKDHRLSRALQLTAQLCYIQNNWSAAGWEFPLKVDPKELVDVLYSDKNKMSADRILNTRGYWLPDEVPSEQEYMSIIDVLEFAANNGLIDKIHKTEVEAELKHKAGKK